MPTLPTLLLDLDGPNGPHLLATNDIKVEKGHKRMKK